MFQFLLDLPTYMIVIAALILGGFVLVVIDQDKTYRANEAIKRKAAIDQDKKYRANKAIKRKAAKIKNIFQRQVDAAQMEIPNVKSMSQVAAYELFAKLSDSEDDSTSSRKEDDSEDDLREQKIAEILAAWKEKADAARKKATVGHEADLSKAQTLVNVAWMTAIAHNQRRAAQRLADAYEKLAEIRVTGVRRKCTDKEYQDYQSTVGKAKAAKNRAKNCKGKAAADRFREKIDIIVPKLNLSQQKADRARAKAVLRIEKAKKDMAAIKNDINFP